MILDTLNEVNIHIFHTQLFDNGKMYLKTKFINVRIKREVTPNILYFIKLSLKFILCHEKNGKIIIIYTYNIFHFIKNIHFVHIA